MSNYKQAERGILRAQAAHYGAGSVTDALIALTYAVMALVDENREIRREMDELSKEVRDATETDL